MKLEAKLALTSISGIITGILVSAGYLDSQNANAFQADIQTAGGLLMSIISLAYLLEHLLVKIKAEVKPKGLPTSVTVTTPTTTIETNEPAQQVPVTPQQ